MDGLSDILQLTMIINNQAINISKHTINFIILLQLASLIYMDSTDTESPSKITSCIPSLYKPTNYIHNYKLANFHLFLHQHINPIQLASAPSITDFSKQEIAKLKQIQDFYPAIWKKIISYNEEAASEKADESDPVYMEYLRLKRCRFIEFYSYKQEVLKQPHSIFMFDSHNLRELFRQIREAMSRLQGRVSQKNDRIEGYALLQKMEQLLKQIRIAVYPFEQKVDYQIRRLNTLFYRNSRDEYLQSVSKIQYREFLLADQSIYNQLQLSKEIFVSHSVKGLGQILDKPQKKSTKKLKIFSQIKSEQRLKNQSRLNYQQYFNNTAPKKSDSVSQQRLMLFYHKTLHHYSKYISNPIELTPAVIAEFLKGEPLLKLSRQHLEQFKTVGQLKQMQLSTIYRFHKKMIAQIVWDQRTKRVVPQKEMLTRFIQLLLSWIELTTENQIEFLLFENLLVLVGLGLRYNQSYIKQNLQSFYITLMRYVRLMKQNLQEGFFQVAKIIQNFDEKLTYELLTSRRIISTLLSQQDKIRQLISQYYPLFKLTSLLDSLQYHQQDLLFLSKLVDCTQYASYIHTQTQQYRVRNVNSANWKVSCTIDNIINMEFYDFDRIRRNMIELKNVMLLIQSIKAGNDHGRNMREIEHYRYFQLKEVEKYFTLKRTQCAFYRLKSLILLFITQFKLGQYTPTYRHRGRKGKLRKRIFNMYTKLFRDKGTQTMYQSKRLFIQFVDRMSSGYGYLADTNNPEGIEESLSQSQQQLFVYSENQRVDLKASESLIERFMNYIKNINKNFKQLQTNAKNYLLNLLSILENQLFDKLKQHNHHSQEVLTKNFCLHLEKSLDYHRDKQSMGKLMQLQGLLYNEKYEQAWKMLIKQKANNQKFNTFINDLLAFSNTRSELLKLIRIQQTFSKMNHMFYKTQNEEQSVAQLLQSVNQNCTLPVGEKEVRAIYRICAEQTRVQQLEQFFQRFKNDNQKKLDGDYKQFKSGLTMQGVVTSKNKKNQKETILIKVSSKYANIHQKMKIEFQKYFLLNQPGISRVNYTKLIDGELWIQIEQNPFFVMLPQNNVSKILLNNDDYKQNSVQKMLRNFALSLMQIYDLLDIGEDIEQRIQNDQYYIKQESKSFNINPYFMLFRTIMTTHSQPKTVKKQHKNRIWLSNLLQNVGSKLKLNFSSHFLSNFITLTQNLKTNTKPSKYSTYLELPLFMTLHQKQIFIIYFYNKMSYMCEKQFEIERELKKQRKFTELNKLQEKNMKLNQVFRNHRYNFIVSGIVERQMIDHQICKSADQSKLDWITNHKNVKISYELPKNENGDIKQRAYSLHIFLECLRGAVAHKLVYDYEIIQSFNMEYPKLVDFLFMRRHLLEVNYSEMIESKNSWFKTYFSSTWLKSKVIQWLNKKYIGSSNEKVIEAHRKLNEYCTLYTNEVHRKLKQAEVRCNKCNDFLKMASSQNNLVNMLQNIAKNMVKKPQLLSTEHNFEDCFLAETFIDHRQIKIFATNIRESKYVHKHLLLNSWFYLQYFFPSLIQVLKRTKLFLETQ